LDSNHCDCEIVISYHNYTIRDWEETDRYFHEQNYDNGGCADRTILSTGDFDTISTTLYLNGEIDTSYQISSGVFHNVSSVYQPFHLKYLNGKYFLNYIYDI
tara:strand:- start:428 stop:733 length:306 start_codon:yes stop_codon:yes gene_type:complete